MLYNSQQILTGTEGKEKEDVFFLTERKMYSVNRMSA